MDLHTLHFLVDIFFLAFTEHCVPEHDSGK